MTTIHLTTQIFAPIEQCFDVARDVDVHKLSTAQTDERAIAGRTTGLCELGDNITWEAKHFGVKQQLSVEITKFNPPYFFEDQMLSGAFTSMRHEHHFLELEHMTEMTDVFEYKVPFGVIGKLFNSVVLKRYMTKFLEKRNQFIKAVAEKNSYST